MSLTWFQQSLVGLVSLAIVMLCFLAAMRQEGANIQSIMILISLVCNVPLFFLWGKIAGTPFTLTTRALVLVLIGGAFGVIGNWGHFNAGKQCIDQNLNPGNAFMITTCYPVIVALVSPLIFPDTFIGIKEIIRLVLFLVLLATYL